MLPAFGIVTFMRPEKLDRLIQSVSRWYPVASVLIADNGQRLPKGVHELAEFHAYLQSIIGLRIDYHVLPFDCGLSACRNFLISQTVGDLLILDDDFEFTEETRIEDLQAVLDENPDIGIVCGNAGTGEPTVFDEDGCTKRTTEKRTTNTGVEFIPCDIADNFMIVRRSVFDAGLRWCPELKVGEHRRFFVQAKELGIKIAYVPSCKVKHDRTGDSSEYQKARCRAVEVNKPFRKPDDPTNIVVLGVGHSGTSPIVRILEALGWNLGEVKKGVAENLAVQELNKQLLLRQGICPCGGELSEAMICGRCGKPTSFAPDPQPYEFANVLSALPQPWCIKDPRLVVTWKRWQWILKSYNPLVLLVERDYERMKRTYRRYKFNDLRIYGHDVAELIEMARYHFAAWDGPKLKVWFEDVIEAAKSFDMGRAER